MQFITDYCVEPNTTADTEIIKERAGHIGAAGCKDLYADGGFYGEDIIEETKREGIEIHYTEMTGAAPKKAITAGDFQYSESDGHIEQCPNGQVPERTAETPAQLTAHFNKSVCSSCPLRGQCPHKENKNSVTVRIDGSGVKSSINF